MNSIGEDSFSENENIEINRRSDELNAIINSGARLMALASELEIKIVERNKSLDSYWYWVFGLIGIGVSLLLRKEFFGFEFNIGSLIFVLTFGYYLIGLFDKAELNKKLTSLNDKLYELEKNWLAVNGYKTFWELKKFIDEYGELDSSSNKFRLWRLEQRHNILDRVCGFERAQKFIEHEKRILKDLENLSEEF
jgi:hypothetical protein